MSTDRKSEDTFKNFTDGFMDSVSELGKKMGNFMDEMFSGDGGEDGVLRIRSDVYYRDKEYVIELELAGVKKEETHLYIHEGVLTVKGVKNPSEGFENFSYQKRERRFGSFIKNFPLPLDVEMENIKAKYDAGLLIIRLPWSGKTKDEGSEVEIS